MNLRKIKVLTIKNWKATLREPAYLFMIILFPIVLTITFNLAFGGMGTSNVTYDIGIVNENESNSNSIYADYFIGNLTDADILNVKYYEDNATAQDLLQQGLLSAIILIPSDFGDSIHSMLMNFENKNIWENTTLYIYTDAASIFAQSAIFPIVQQKLYESIFGPNPSVELSIKIEDNTFNSNDTPNQFDMMAPGLFAFSIMFLTMIVAQSIVTEREQGIVKRMSTTPVKSSEIITSHILSNIVLSAIQVIMVFYMAVLTGYNPTIGTSELLLGFSIAIIYSITTVGFGLITASIAKTSGAATGLSFIFILPQMMLGTFVPIPSDIGRFMPSYYVTDAFTSLLVRGASITSPVILYDLLVVSLISITVFFVGILFYEKLGNK